MRRARSGPSADSVSVVARREVPFGQEEMVERIELEQLREDTRSADPVPARRDAIASTSRAGMLP